MPLTVHCDAALLFHFALHRALTSNRRTSSVHSYLVSGLVQCRLSAQVLLANEKMRPWSRLLTGDGTMTQHLLQDSSAAFFSPPGSVSSSTLSGLDLCRGLFIQTFSIPGLQFPYNLCPLRPAFSPSSNQYHLGLALLWPQHAAAGLQHHN